MNGRNQTLMMRFESHPLRENLESALAVSERFSAASGRIKANSDLSQTGREKELTAQARQALRDLRDLRKPLEEMQTRRARLHDGVQRKQFDKSDIVGAMNRAEIRSVIASLQPPDRIQALFDPVFRDAVLEQPPLVSGIKSAGELKIYEDAKSAQLADMHGPLMQELQALDEEIDGARAVLDVARNDVKAELGVADGVFEEFAKPIEKRLNAPWLKRIKDSSGAERIHRITAADPDFDKTSSGSRLATPDEIRDGKFYADHAEFLADRSAA